MGGEPLPLPLAAYRWTAAVPAATFSARHLPSTVQPLSPVFTVDDPIRARWADVKDPEGDEWIGIFPAGDMKSARLTFAQIRGKRSGEATMRAMAPGKYELRLFRENGWDLLAVSTPFEVVPAKPH